MTRLPQRKAFIRRPWIGYFFAAAISLLVASLLGLLLGIQPNLHDEFSYLLAADTFAAGRLTNPTPSHPEFFESFHILVEPSYCSKYPPGFPMLLAIGILLTSSPTFGLALSAALAGASVYYAARGIFSARWAFAPVMLVMLSVNAHVFWSLKYMPGWICVAASSLVLGACLRLRRRYAPGSTSVAGVGIVLLGMTRPYEGLIFTLACAIVFAVWKAMNTVNSISPCSSSFLMRRGYQALTSLFMEFRQAWAAWVMFAIVMLGGAVGFCCYNLATTGKATRLAYQVHESQYGLAPLLLSCDPPANEPNYHHREIERFHREVCLTDFIRLQSPAAYMEDIPRRLSLLLSTLGMPTALLALIGLVVGPRAKYFLASIFLAVAVSSLVVPWNMPHYFACALPPIALLGALGLQQIGRKFAGSMQQRSDRTFAAVLGVQGLLLLAGCISLCTRPDTKFHELRHQAITKLQQSDGKKLVFVRYSENHDLNEEWVYNAASLQRSEIVWARDMGARNIQLRGEFRDRNAFLLTVSNDRIELESCGPIEPGKWLSCHTQD